MSYRIGDLSKLLNMSVETIRYYESKNIIQPGRLENSNYRIYETWDLFYLLECIKYKSFRFSLKEINYAINEGTAQDFINKLAEKASGIQDEINYNILLTEKLEQQRIRLETAVLNQGNYWIKKIPERYYFYCLASNGDGYDDFDLANPLFSQWLKYMPFVSTYKHSSIEDFENGKNNDKWSFAIEKKYAERLNLPLNETVKALPEQIYMSTIVNAGEKGELTMKLLEPAISYTKNKGYKINDEILGEVLLRAHENGKYYRYFEIEIPITQ